MIPLSERSSRRRFSSSLILSGDATADPRIADHATATTDLSIPPAWLQQHGAWSMDAWHGQELCSSVATSAFSEHRFQFRK